MTLRVKFQDFAKVPYSYGTKSIKPGLTLTICLTSVGVHFVTLCLHFVIICQQVAQLMLTPHLQRLYKGERGNDISIQKLRD